MANFKKIDDQDLVFINKPLTAKEEKDFTDYLKSRKSKAKNTRISRSKSTPKKEMV